MNPQHTVPTLDDNGKYLWDSHAISIYLIEKYGQSDDHSLYPKDLYTRARIHQRLHFESGVLFPSLLSVILTVLFDGSVELSRKEVGTIRSGYEMLETFLATDPYLVGDHLTLADFSVITTLTQLATLVELDSIRYPKITSWIVRLEGLPFFNDINTVMMASFGEIFNNLIANNIRSKLI